MPKIARTHRRTRSTPIINRRKESRPPIDAPSTRYEILVRGHLDSRWSVWFDGMTITTNDGETIIAGDNLDQPRLRGMLNKIWDLNLTLVSVARIERRRKRLPQ